jgi:hypothetical protein
MIRVFIDPLDVTVSIDEAMVEKVYQEVLPLIPVDFCDKPQEGYGYPDDLVLCVTDSIWSIGVSYVKHVIPVRDRVRGYRTRQNLSLKSPEEFLTHFASHLGDRGEWLAGNVFENFQKTSTAVSAWRKSYAIQRTLEILREYGISTPTDLLGEIKNKKLRSALESVPGDSIGVRTDYIFMLAGCTDLAKYDRQISRFLGLKFNGQMRLYAIALLTEVANRLRERFPCINTRSVDHFIWQAMSDTEDGFEAANATPGSQASGSGVTIPPVRPPVVGAGMSGHSTFEVSSDDSICHDCYLVGLNRFLIERKPHVSERSWRQYRADGKRFERAYREGGTSVKNKWQALPIKACFSMADYPSFEAALRNGGIDGASAYRTPIKGAFDLADSCDVCPLSPRPL